MTPFSFRAFMSLLLSSSLLGACSTFKPPEIAYDDLPIPASLQGDPPGPVKIVEVPKILPLPGQLKSLARGKGERPEPMEVSTVKLTSMVRNPGCASKIPAADLEEILSRLPKVEDPRVLSGLAAADDADSAASTDGAPGSGSIITLHQRSD